MPLEFITYSAVTSLADAAEVVEAVGRANVRLLVDSLQFFGAGAEFDLLSNLPAELFPYAQLSDGLWLHLARSEGYDGRRGRHG